MTTPPFPYARPTVQEPVGLPVLFDETLTAYDRRHLHYGEVGMKDGQLVTSGAYGWTMVVTGTGPTVQWRVTMQTGLLNASLFQMRATGAISARG